MTAAARSLHRSQPAVSHRLRQLEESFGLPLFERVGRELHLTEAGDRLLEEAVEILARLRSLPQAVVGADALRGTVRVGTFPTFARHLLLPAIQRVLREYDEVKPVFRFSTLPNLRNELLSGSIDMMIVAGELDTSGLQEQRIGEVRIAVGVANSDSPPGRMTLGYLRERRYLAWRGPPDPTFESIEEWALSKGLVTDTTPEIPHIATLRALAATGLGYVVLPDYVMREDEAAGRLRTYPAPGLNRAFAVRLVVRKGWVGGTVADRVRDALAVATAAPTK